MLFSIRVARDVMPLGGEYYVDDDGFRFDTVGVDAQALADIAPTTSLAILGEPGIGKTGALLELTASDENVIVIALGTVADVRDLRDELDAVDAAVAKGITPDRITLVLDGVDECPIPPKTLIRNIEDTLQRHHAPRVVLGCRTADWPESLGHRLQALLPNFEVVELLPLGRTDIATLAATRGVNGGAFLTAVNEAAAVPLAVLPLTLDLLLVAYQQAGQLPASATELYEQGLLALVEEPDSDREPGKKPVGSAPQRLAVAAKLAAYTMLCGRSAIARDAPAGAGELLAGALSAGTEPIDGGDLTITDELLRATLTTALFTGRGAGRLAVVHASIAAYLTARYLTAHAVPEHQLRALLTRTNSLGRTRVPSRLRETAAWLVALEADRNGWIVAVDPEALAEHSGLVNVAAVRRALVDYLLDTPNPELRTARRRWRLGHSGLAVQLRPALHAPLTQDDGAHLGQPVLRRAQVAVEIARRGGGLDSVPDLVDLLLSSTTDSYLRSSAAYALIDLDASTAAQTLRSVLDEVTTHPDHDPDDELRGLALQTNWPDTLTATELVDALTHPQRRDFLGTYAFFLFEGRFLDDVGDQVITDLMREITPDFDGDGEGAGGGWVDEQDPVSDAASARPLPLLTGPRRGERVMTKLLDRALASAQLDVMVDEVGWLLAAGVRHHHSVAVPARFSDSGDRENPQNEQLRHALVLAALRHIPAKQAGLLVLRVLGGTPWLLKSTDLEWLLSLGGTEWEAHAAQLIRFVFDITDTRQQELVWAHRGEPIFEDSVAHWFRAVDLDSPQADLMREEHEWSLSRDRTWEGAAAHESALRAAWAQCERSELDGFLVLCERLRVDPTSGRVTDTDDLTSWPGYSYLTVDEAVLRAAAESYLRSGNTGGDGWLKAIGTMPIRAFAGYVALAYLARRPDGDSRLDALPAEVWRRWTPAILGFFTGHCDPAVRATLKQKAQQRVPDDYREWVLRRLEVKVDSGRALDPADDFTGEYDDTIGDHLDAVLHGIVDTVASIVAALDKPSEPSDGPQQLRPSEIDLRPTLSIARSNAMQLARFLAPRRDRTAVWLRELAECAGAARVETRVLATEVLLPMGMLNWDDVFARMQGDEDFGTAMAVVFARERGDEVATPHLAAEQLAELWRWLDERWSSQTDTLVNGFVSDDQRVRDWRNSIVAELQARATPDALAALAGLVDSRPDNYRLQAALADAEARDYDGNWQGVEIAELTALLANGRRTLVNDDDALYRAVLASLERFAVRMRDIGQTLWNESRPAGSANGEARVWNPKYESAVSAALRDHLKQEFGEQLVVNREVLVKQTTSKGHGLSVDVLPTSTEADAGHHLPTCPIEVKGCWNPKLLTDLQAQLVTDYLPATGATRGIYLCAWFPIGQWDDFDDSRRATAAARDRDQVAQSLADAARVAAQSGEIEVAAVVIDIPRPTPSSRAAGASTGGNQAS
ncbi:hypothetical protein [Cellulomonas sp. P24]|uniref:hypothetical protein n=1 Tax=Cellulomonas sp. P24 TaxID=2885206 RepID=UPI00216AE812|nr:hypothetical protein [Cellulomonas sp. P24]MCR6491437.1 hypothetical protein [Cellulomonas sp. P24]